MTCRCLHLLPEHLGLASSIAKYFVPTRVESMLAMIGRQCGYEQSERSKAEAHAHLAKVLRDNRIVSFFDGNTVVNLQSVATHLKKFALQAASAPSVGSADTAAADALFDLATELPDIDFRRLHAGHVGPDVVMNSLRRALQQPDDVDATIRAAAAEVLSRYEALLARLAGKDRRLGPREPAVCDAASSYCVLHATACAYLVWRANRGIGLAPEFDSGHWLLDVIRGCLDGQDIDDLNVHETTLAWMERLHVHERAFSILPLAAPFQMQ